MLPNNHQNAFNQDWRLYLKFVELRDKHGLTTVVETGTYLGQTTHALAEIFDSVLTCEVNPQYLAEARKTPNERINFCEMSSPSFIKSLNPLSLKNSVFFLDAHWGTYNPLIDELKAIAEIGLKPIIVIHDFFVPGKSDPKAPRGNFGFDQYPDCPYTYEWIDPHIKAIYGEDFTYSYPEEVEGAKRGYIIIEPK